MEIQENMLGKLQILGDISNGTLLKLDDITYKIVRITNIGTSLSSITFITIDAFTTFNELLEKNVDLSKYYTFLPIVSEYAGISHPHTIKLKDQLIGYWDIPLQLLLSSKVSIMVADLPVLSRVYKQLDEELLNVAEIRDLPEDVIVDPDLAEQSLEAVPPVPLPIKPEPSTEVPVKRGRGRPKKVLI